MYKKQAFHKTLKKNEFYHIDKEYVNGGRVKFLGYNSKIKLTCRVEDPDTGAIWETMTNRLSKLESNG